MKCAALKQIITEAAADAGCNPSETERLVATADQIDRVAVGEFFIREPGYSCGCPATVAGFWDPDAHNGIGGWVAGTSNQVAAFPQHFDTRFQTPALRLTPKGGWYVEVED